MLERLRSRLTGFMYGRYGSDQLNRDLFITVLVFMFMNMIVQSSVINGLVLLLLVMANYRTFSKNIYRRQAENRQYLNLMKPVKKTLRLNLRRVREFRDYSFKKCPDCQQVLRLKRRRGKHSTVCPKCGSKMDVRIYL